MNTNFTKERFIAKGEYGSVYLCKNDFNKAIKLVEKRSEIVLDVEIEMLQRVQSDFVIKLYQWCESETHIGLQIEMMWGGDLYSYIYHDKYRYIPSEQHDYYQQIVLAIRYIHNKGIIHRDIKLENILLTYRKKIKLADFAFAVSYNPIDDGSKEKVVDDKFYKMIGTVPYLSPEMIARKGYDRATDIWSSGVILYEMISGHLPFIAESSDETMNMICNYEYSPLQVSRKLQQLVAGVLEKDPAKRWTADEILSHM